MNVHGHKFVEQDVIIYAIKCFRKIEESDPNYGPSIVSSFIPLMKQIYERHRSTATGRPYQLRIAAAIYKGNN